MTKMDEIQRLREHATSESDIKGLIREALYIATKYEFHDFLFLIKRELYGYHEDDSIPPYRTLHGDIVCRKKKKYSCIANDEGLPLQIIRVRKTIQDMLFLVNHSDNEWIYFDLNESLSKYLVKHRRKGDYKLRVPVSQVIASIEMVRNIILEWAIFLEENGFDKNEQCNTKTTSNTNGLKIFIIQQNITYTFENYKWTIGEVQNMGKNVINANGSGKVVIQQDVKDSEQFVVQQDVKSLDDSVFVEAETILKEILGQESQFMSVFGDKCEDLKNELNNAQEAIADKNETNLRKAWQSLKNLSSNVAGSLIASGILGLLNKLPTLL